MEIIKMILFAVWRKVLLYKVSRCNKKARKLNNKIRKLLVKSETYLDKSTKITESIMLEK